MKRCGVLAALALLCAACGGTATTTGASTTSTAGSTTTTTAATTTTRPVRPPTTTTTEAPTAPTGGRVVVPVYVEPGAAFSFSPWSRGFVPAIGELYLAGAEELDPNLDFAPDLLTEMPTTDNGGVAVHPDGTMTVTYRIRPEAVWDDGTPVSGEDFAFTLETVVGLPLPDPEFALYQTILPETVAVGEKTFSYTLPRETIDYERLFRVVLPRHAVAGTDPAAWTSAPWASAGPFRFVGWTEGVPGEVGSALRFVRNETYWRTDRVGEPLPYLDEVEFRLVAGAREAVEAFARGQADVVGLGNWPDVVERLQSLGGVSLAVGDGTTWEHLAFQFGVNDDNSRSLNRLVDFRRAVAHALDRAALVQGPTWLNGGALSSFLSITSLRGTSGWDRYAYDPGAAAALLDEACAEADRDCAVAPPLVAITTTSGGTLRGETATRAQEMLEAAGLRVQVVLAEPEDLFGPVFQAGSWDVGLWAWEVTGGLSGLVRTLAYWDPAGAPPVGLNYQRWGTPAVEGYDAYDQEASTVVNDWTRRYAALLDEMHGTADRTRLQELVAEAEEILADQVVVIPLATRGNGIAWWSDAVAGARHHPGRPATWNIERWYRADG